MKFKDMIESVISELVETPSDKKFLAKAKIKWGKSDERNKNGRIYSDLVVAPAILKFNKEAQANAGVLGNLDHPIGTSGTLLSNASHLVSRVWKDENKNWFADVNIMNTSKGKDLLAVLKAGTKIGASLRGVGEVDKNGNVKSGIEFHAIDFVSSPSFGAAASVDQSSVFESFLAEEEGDEFTNEDLKEITNAMNGLSDSTVEMIQQKLEKSEGIMMTEARIQGLILWIKCSKDNKNILPFAEWYVDQQKKFGVENSNFQEEINSKLRREANTKAEKRLAGFSCGANTMFKSRERIEARQKKIDEALSGKKMSDKTISRLFAEACLAGYKGSRADWIREFGF